MAIAVDASSPARANAPSGQTITTATFDPPAAVLLATVQADAVAQAIDCTITNNGTALTWTAVAERDGGDAGGNGGYAAAFVAVLAAGRTDMTVTATVGTGAARPSIKLYVLTGADTTDPIGASGEGSSTDEAATTTAITTTVGNLGVVVGCDFDDTGLPSSSDTTEDAFDISGLAGLSGYKPIAAASTTFNLTAGGAGPAWNYVTVEINAAPDVDPNPKVETIVDDFNDDTIDPQWDTFGTAVEAGGVITLASTSTFSGLETPDDELLDLTGSTLFVALVDVPADTAESEGGAGTGQALLVLRTDANNQLRIGWQNDLLVAEAVIGGTFDALDPPVAYSATDHRWLRIAEAGGNITWATSPDATTWTTRRTETTLSFTAGITAVQAQLIVGEFGEVTPSGDTGAFDNVNVVSSDRTILPDTIASTATVGQPTILAGNVTISPGTITSTSTVGEPTIKGSATILPTSIASTAVVGEPSILAGGVTIQPGTIASTSTVGEPILALSIWGLSDGFSGTELADHWTTTVGTPEVSGGRLHLACTDFSDTSTGVFTGTLYDLTNSGILVELIEVPTVGNGSTQAFLRLFTDTDNQLLIGVFGDELWCVYEAEGTTDTLELDYDAVAHRWLRIWEHAGRIRWDTSADGKIWVTRREIATSLMTAGITAISVVLACGFSGTETDPGESEWDNLNLPTLVHTNSLWPQVTHEIAFNIDPADPAAGEAEWTDIGTHVDGWDSKRGRQYELDQMQAGTHDLKVTNNAGDLSPTNTFSPYSPNVLPYRKIRTRGFWKGVTYDIYGGFVERWPQHWERHGTYGYSDLVCVDAFAALAEADLRSALDEEILLDQPIAFYPLSEPSDSHQAGSIAATPQPPARFALPPGGGGEVVFGAESIVADPQSCLEFVNDSGAVGFGTTLRIADAEHGGGPFVSNVAGGTGWAFELWFKAEGPMDDFGTLIHQSAGNPGGISLNNGIVELRTDGRLDVGPTDGTNSLTATPLGTRYDDNTTHHVVLTMEGDAKTWHVYVDGEEVLTDTNALVVPFGVPRPGWINVGGTLTTAARFDFLGDGNLAWVSHVAIYDKELSAARVAVHYQASLDAFADESTGARVERILDYAGWTGESRIDTGDSTAAGAVDLPGKTALAAIQDAAMWETGVFLADTDGAVIFVQRSDRYNADTVRTFGEDTNLGETPYEGDVQIDFDPSRIINKVTVTRTGGAVQVAYDETSIKKYFQRSAEREVGIDSDLEALDLANFLIYRYASPKSRMPTLSLKPSANPKLWPVALGTRIGDRVTVYRRPPEGSRIELDCFIESVAHSVTAGEWVTTFELSPADLDFWELDHPTDSQLDVSTVLAY